MQSTLKKDKMNKTIYARIEKEVRRQVDLWGEQNHQDVTNGDVEYECSAREYYRNQADLLKMSNEYEDKAGVLTWETILLEEVYEALAESDPEKVKNELVQAAAVIVTWINCIERRVLGNREEKENAVCQA
jgi:hypothetical protein